MFESARSALELDEEQLGAMDEILKRVLSDETDGGLARHLPRPRIRSDAAAQPTPRAAAGRRGRGAAMKWWTSNEKRTVLAVRFHRDRSVLWPQLANASFKRLQGRIADMMTP